MTPVPADVVRQHMEGSFPRARQYVIVHQAEPIRGGERHGMIRGLCVSEDPPIIKGRVSEGPFPTWEDAAARLLVRLGAQPDEAAAHEWLATRYRPRRPVAS